MTAPPSQTLSNPAGFGHAFRDRVAYHLKYSVGGEKGDVTPRCFYNALALSIREKLIDGMQASRDADKRSGRKRVHYLSMEFLIGRCTHNNLISLDLYEEAESAAAAFGFTLADILETENDPALGNGGLGRLAACFLDSMATLDIAGFGYGINYDFGLFRQKFSNGYQQEVPDHWKNDGAPWLIERPEKAHVIPVYGQVFDNVDGQNRYNPSWMNWQTIIGEPADLPIVGYGGKRANYLRLYSARASDEFDIKIFNDGDYMNALEQKIQSERISKILYPEDSAEAGKELRLLQEYFFVACAIRDIIDDHLETHADCRNLHDFHAIQLNDTHPALAVAELMRLLVDEHRLPWEKAWFITVNTCGYTNHTLLPEALECWPYDLLAKVLPRHIQLIEEIDRRFVADRRAAKTSDADIEKMRILTGDVDARTVRMANLSIIGSHSTNGVAALHTDLVKSTLVPEFNALWPERFNNKTNGVTQRRWLKQANPALSTLITEAIGDRWITDLDELRKLEPLAEDAAFNQRFADAKNANKALLADLIFEKTRVRVDTASLFDAQVKRLHEYKRQLLNVLHIIHQYFSIVEDGVAPAAPVTYVFGGKAAPGYFMAKRIIKLINNLASIFNQDPRVSPYLKIAYIPDYRVSVAERIFPGANVSEQISTAGFEASGTGNMKFALNGALTVGTMDGANVEICEEVGRDNIYIFGKTVEEINALKASDEYTPWEIYHNNPRLKRVLDALNSDIFSPGEPTLFEPIYYSLLAGGDYFCLLADFQSYIDCQETVREDFCLTREWNRRAILNVARMGKFSSDRTIREYADEIWSAPHNLSAATNKTAVG